MKPSRKIAIVVIYIIVMVTLVGVQKTSAARILMAVPISTRSHENFFIPIAENLAKRNHTITYLSGFESTKQRPNIRVVFVPDVQLFKNPPNLFTTDPHVVLASLYDDMMKLCIKALAYEGVQSLNDEKYDLIILHAGLTECFLSFVHKMKVPFIFVHPNKIVGAQAPLTGSPAFPSVNANFLLDLEYPLTFTGRTISTLYDQIGLIFNNWFLLPSQESECRALQLCPEDMPSLHDLRLNSSLFITNSVKTMEYPNLPYTPIVVHAGGLHCRPAKPLPQDLQQWISEAGTPGFILFSLGTVVKSSTMPEKYKKVLVDVFGSLKQRVLWKWDEITMDGLPSNVRLSKWLPQQDILAHPELRLFITHGGLFSTQEASYHGVSILGIPISIDQHHNMRMVQQEGWGRVLHWRDLSFDSLRNLILQTMDDPRLKEDVQRRSRIMRDQPMSPGNWATYWIEYVLRHQGAAHLRSPALQIPWYQLYNVDVWALLAAVIIVTSGLSFWLSYRILLFLVRCCFWSKKKKDD